jgi:hypothetical protein
VYPPGSNNKTRADKKNCPESGKAFSEGVFPTCIQGISMFMAGKPQYKQILSKIQIPFKARATPGVSCQTPV